MLFKHKPPAFRFDKDYNYIWINFIGFILRSKTHPQSSQRFRHGLQGNCIMEFCSKMHLKFVMVCHCEPPLLFFGGDAIPHFVKINSILEQSLLLHELEIASMPSQSLRQFAMTLFLWNKWHFPGQKRIVKHKMQSPWHGLWVGDLFLSCQVSMINVLFFTIPIRFVTKAILKKEIQNGKCIVQRSDQPTR